MFKNKRKEKKKKPYIDLKFTPSQYIPRNRAN